MANAYRTDPALRALDALGHSSRRAIVARLAEAPARVGRLATALPITRSAVSQHLRVLEEAGLVAETSWGARRIWRLDPAGLAAARDWLDGRWAAALDAFVDLADQFPAATQEDRAMTIAPIRKCVHTKARPERAFDVFTAGMGRWWPRGRTVGAAPHADIVVEPFVGGRWFERDGEGRETPWGRVLAWEPPHRLVLAWQLDASKTYDPDLITEVEIAFAPADGGGTEVRLEHRDLERFRKPADAWAAAVTRGWTEMLDIFADFADRDDDSA